MPNLAVTTLAADSADPNVIYAGTGEGFYNGDAVRGAGIFKTTDGGATWVHLAATKNSNFYYVNKIVTSPMNPNVVYAATNKNLYKSTDAGATWVALLGLSTRYLDLTVTNFFDGGANQDYIYTWQGSYGLAVSHDSGATFTYGVGTGLYDSTMYRGSIAVSKSNPAIAYVTVYAGSSNPVGVYKTTDYYATAGTQVL